MFPTFKSIMTRSYGSSSPSWRMSRWWMRDTNANVQASLVRVLATAYRERLDLAPLVAAFAEEHRGAARRRLRRLAQRLNEGVSLAKALEQTPDALSDEQTLTVRFATESGTLAAAYQSLIDRHTLVNQQTSIRVRQAFVYGACLFLVVSLILSFMMLFIAPTFAYIYEYLGLKLNPLLEGLIATCDFVAGVIPSALVLAAIVALVVWYFKPVRFLRRTFSFWLVRPIAQLRTAHLLRMLAQGADAGRPIAGSLSTLARYHFDKQLRIKLLFVRNELEQGAELCSCLAEAGLLSRNEAQALTGMSSPRMRAWLMRRLAQWKESRVQQRAAILSTLLHPAIVLLFGVLVLWIATAFFSVLTTMISSLS